MIGIEKELNLLFTFAKGEFNFRNGFRKHQRLVFMKGKLLLKDGFARKKHKFTKETTILVKTVRRFDIGQKKNLVCFLFLRQERFAKCYY